jgi:hypothetical protein
MPISTQGDSSSSVAIYSALTRSQPGISRPRMTATVTGPRAVNSSVRSGSARNMTPPCPLALIAR